MEVMEGADVVLSSLDFRPNLPEAIRGGGAVGEAGADWVEFPVTLYPAGRLTIFIRKALWSAYLAKQWPPLPVQQ